MTVYEMLDLLFMKQGRMGEREGQVSLQEFLRDLVTIAPTNLDSKKARAPQC